MVLGRLLSLCKREDQNIEDNRGKVCLANGEKHEIHYRQGLKVRDLCIDIAKSLEIAPVALDFFTLMTTECEHCLKPTKQTRQECSKTGEHYLNPKRLLHAEECETKVFYFRLAFKAIAGPDIKNVDKEAFSYFVMQCRWDYLNGRIAGLTKKDYLTLLVLECIIRGHEHNVSGKDVLDSPKKFGLHHMFVDEEFSAREIRTHLKKQIVSFKTSQESLEKASKHFLDVLEGVEDFGINKVTVNKFYVNNNSSSSDVHQVEWEILIGPSGLKKRRTYKDEGDFDTSSCGQPSGPKDEIISNYKDIEYLEVKQSESTEIIHISRMKGFLEVISVGKSIAKKESLITLIEGFYRLLVNQYKDLTKYQPGLELPLLQRQKKELEIHGPIERKKAENLLKAVCCTNGDNRGVHLIRRSRSRFDHYNLSFIGENMIRHYEVQMTQDQKYGIANGPKFDSLVQMLKHYEIPERGLSVALKKYCPVPHDGLCALFDEQIVLEPQPPPNPPTSARPQNEEYQFLQIGNMELQKVTHTFENGNYGDKVFKARWLKTDDGGCQEVFCRKLAMLTRTPESKEKVIAAATKMSKLVHRNLVQLLCVCFFNEQNTYLGFEWITLGTLDDYIIKKTDITVGKLISFAAQTAEACMYLHSENFVHGWLTAHNVLVASEDQVKVSDVSVPCLREEGLLPITDEVNRSPWKARECFLDRPFSKESDVWAFGVVLWEMFTKAKPFHNMDDQQIINVYQRNLHLACPKCCPSDVCWIMKSCWNLTEPSHRPTFMQIVEKLRSLSLSDEEKKRTIPNKIDENFTLEPLTMTNKPQDSFTEEQQSCTSNGVEIPSTCMEGSSTKSSITPTSYSCSSADSDDLDFLPEKDTHVIDVWSPEEIELKIMERKHILNREVQQSGIYDCISNATIETPLQTTRVIKRGDKVPSELENTRDSISCGDKVVELPTKQQRPEESHTSVNYPSIRNMDHVDFLACQFGQFSSTTEPEVTVAEKCDTHRDDDNRVVKVTQEAEAGHDSNDITSCLDPFSTDSDKFAAMLFSRMGERESRVQMSAKTTNDSSRKLVELPYECIKPPIPSVPKESVRKTNTPRGASAPATRSRGLIEFSKLDPFASTENIPLLDDARDAGGALKSSAVAAGPSTDPKRPLLGKHTSSRRDFCSYLERDPFAEILGNHANVRTQAASNAADADAATYIPVVTGPTRTHNTSKGAPNGYIAVPQSLIRTQIPNNRGYIATPSIHNVQQQRPVSMPNRSGYIPTPTSASLQQQQHAIPRNRGYIPASSIRSVQQQGSITMPSRASYVRDPSNIGVGQERGKAGTTEKLPALSYSRRDPFSDIFGASDASSRDQSTHARTKPEYAVADEHRAPLKNGYARTPVNDHVGSEPDHSFEATNLSHRDVFSDILRSQKGQQTTKQNNPGAQPTSSNDTSYIRGDNYPGANPLSETNETRTNRNKLDIRSNYSQKMDRVTCTSSNNLPSSHETKNSVVETESEKSPDSYTSMLDNIFSDKNISFRSDNSAYGAVKLANGNRDEKVIETVASSEYNRLENDTADEKPSLSTSYQSFVEIPDSDTKKDCQNPANMALCKETLGSDVTKTRNEYNRLEDSDSISNTHVEDGKTLLPDGKNTENLESAPYNKLEEPVEDMFFSNTQYQKASLSRDENIEIIQSASYDRFEEPVKGMSFANTQYQKTPLSRDKNTEIIESASYDRLEDLVKDGSSLNTQYRKTSLSRDRNIEIPESNTNELNNDFSLLDGKSTANGHSSADNKSYNENTRISSLDVISHLSYDKLSNDEVKIPHELASPANDPEEVSPRDITTENYAKCQENTALPTNTGYNKLNDCDTTSTCDAIPLENGRGRLTEALTRDHTSQGHAERGGDETRTRNLRKTKPGYCKLGTDDMDSPLTEDDYPGTQVDHIIYDAFNGENLLDDLVPSIEPITKKGKSRAASKKDVDTNHVSRYLDLTFEHAGPFRDSSAVSQFRTDKKPYSEPLFQDTPVNGESRKPPSKYSNFEMADLFAQLIPPGDGAPPEKDSALVTDSFPEEEPPGNKVRSIVDVNEESPTESRPTTRDTTRDMRGGVPQRQSDEIPVVEENLQQALHDEPQKTSDGSSAGSGHTGNDSSGNGATTGNGPPSGNDPDGGSQPSGSSERAVTRKTSDIGSAYAKVSIKSANVYTKIITSEVAVTEAVAGETVPDGGGEEPDSGAVTADAPGEVEEESVRVDPFNITAAEETIQNLDRYGKRTGVSESFEKSMKTNVIPYHNLSFNDKEPALGKGAFGVVRRAKLTRLAQHKTRPSVDVAVKCLLEGATEIYKNGFKQEAINLMRLDNKFIVRFLGISYDEEEKLLLVTELVPKGSLDLYLRDPKNMKILGNEVLLQFSIQITMGMQYLESKKLVHRDLAARNILVATESHVKISDFGLSRIYDDDYYRSKRENQKLPIKWLAPECLEHKIFTTSSDVWSLGVTLWEMFSYGQLPYNDMKFRSAQELMNYLKAGERLERPKACLEEVFTRIRECWKLEPNDRISFFLLKFYLEKVLEEKYQRKPYFM